MLWSVSTGTKNLCNLLLKFLLSACIDWIPENYFQDLCATCGDSPINPPHFTLQISYGWIGLLSAECNLRSDSLKDARNINYEQNKATPVRRKSRNFQKNANKPR